MKWILLVCGALIWGMVSLAAQEPSPATTPTPVPAPAATAAPVALPSAAVDDETQLLAIEQEWGNACLHSDVDYLSRLLADDFVFTDERAGTGDKAQALREARERKMHYTLFENHDLMLHLHGDTAVVTGRTCFKGTVAATGKLVDADTQFTDVFARIQGRWRAVAAHVSRVGSGL